MSSEKNKRGRRRLYSDEERAAKRKEQQHRAYLKRKEKLARWRQLEELVNELSSKK
jgi:hypothetical protein